MVFRNMNTSLQAPLLPLRKAPKPGKSSVFLLQKQGRLQQFTIQHRALNTLQLYAGSSSANQSGRSPAGHTVLTWRQAVGERKLLCSQLTHEVPLQHTPGHGTCLRATNRDLWAEQPAAPRGTLLPMPGSSFWVQKLQACCMSALSWLTSSFMCCILLWLLFLH